MPTSKRRRTGPAAAATAAATQSTLSFRGDTARITKANAPTTKDTKAKSHAIQHSPTPPPASIDITPSSTTHDQEEEVAEVAPEQSEEAEEEEEPHPLLTQAHSLTPADIRTYWTAKQSARKAPRVHQDNLPLHEKILREFDLTSRFGPCVGVSREKRWWRANALGLEPPVEVLAVLVNDDLHVEAVKGKKGAREKVRVTSVMDRLIDGEAAAAAASA